MSATELSTLMSALQPQAAGNHKRSQHEFTAVPSFQDVFDNKRQVEQQRERKNEAAAPARQADTRAHREQHDKASNMAADRHQRDASPRDEADGVNAKHDSAADTRVTDKPRNSTQADSHTAKTRAVSQSDSGESQGGDTAKSDTLTNSGIFILKSTAAQTGDKADSLDFASGVDIEAEQLIETEAPAGEELVIAQSVLAGATQASNGTPMGNTAKLTGQVAAADKQGQALQKASSELDVELDLAESGEGAEGLDFEPATPGTGKSSKLLNAGELAGNQGKSLADIKADLGKLSATKLDVAASNGSTAAKAGIEHAQGASGLNHSYLIDRNGSVQGKAIMQSPMMAKQWNAEMAEKVAWFAAKNISSAEIRLDPPELGSLQIKINVNQEQGQAQVNFVSPNANVREALDQSATRLREQFEAQGMDLDVDVSSQQEHAQGEAADGDSNLVADGAEQAEEQEVQRLKPMGNSLVDSYA